MASQDFQGDRRHKADHRQATVELFCVGIEPKLRLTALDVAHLRLDRKVVEFTLIVSDFAGSHGGYLR